MISPWYCLANRLDVHTTDRPLHRRSLFLPLAPISGLAILYFMLIVKEKFTFWDVFIRGGIITIDLRSSLVTKRFYYLLKMCVCVTFLCRLMRTYIVNTCACVCVQSAVECQSPPYFSVKGDNLPSIYFIFAEQGTSLRDSCSGSHFRRNAVSWRSSQCRQRKLLFNQTLVQTRCLSNRWFKWFVCQLTWAENRERLCWGFLGEGGSWFFFYWVEWMVPACVDFCTNSPHSIPAPLTHKSLFPLLSLFISYHSSFFFFFYCLYLSPQRLI